MASTALVNKYKKLIMQRAEGAEKLTPAEYSNPLGKMVAEWADTIINKMQAEIDDGRGNSTTLGQEIESKGFEIIEGSTIRLDVQAPLYWKFFNYGVSGAANIGSKVLGMPKATWRDGTPSHHGAQVYKSLKGFQFKDKLPTPVRLEGMTKNIRQWIPTTGLFGGLPNKEYDKVAYAVAINVKKRGIKAVPFLETVLEKNGEVEKFAEELSEVTTGIFEVLFSDKFETK